MSPAAQYPGDRSRVSLLTTEVDSSDTNPVPIAPHKGREKQSDTVAASQYQLYRRMKTDSPAQNIIQLRHARLTAQNGHQHVVYQSMVQQPQTAEQFSMTDADHHLAQSSSKHAQCTPESLCGLKSQVEQGGATSEEGIIGGGSSNYLLQLLQRISARVRGEYLDPGEKAPESHRAQPVHPLGMRIFRSIAAPASIVCAVAFITLLGAIVLVMVQPHTPNMVAQEDPAPLKQDASEVPHTEVTESPKVFVHVVGAVNEPGLVEIPGGSRVSDAVAAAGGATDVAVTSGVNLARIVNDGEQIIVPDTESANVATPHVLPLTPSTGSGGLVDLNTATSTELESLPRVGPALAARIIEWRTLHGGFRDVEQLTEVAGIGEKMLAGITPLATVS